MALFLRVTEPPSRQKPCTEASSTQNVRKTSGLLVQTVHSGEHCISSQAPGTMQGLWWPRLPATCELKNLWWQVLGTRVRHSARGKGHEEGGSTYAKAGSSLRSPPGYSWASTPQNQCLPTLLLCALPSDFTGGCPPPPSHSLCQRANLQLQLIKFLGN